MILFVSFFGFFLHSVFFFFSKSRYKSLREKNSRSRVFSEDKISKKSTRRGRSHPAADLSSYRNGCRWDSAEPTAADLERAQINHVDIVGSFRLSRSRSVSRISPGHHTITTEKKKRGKWASYRSLRLFVFGRWLSLTRTRKGEIEERQKKKNLGRVYYISNKRPTLCGWLFGAVCVGG
jgi:hypothetical protein